jgi:hypothetical protein
LLLKRGDPLAFFRSKMYAMKKQKPERTPENKALDAPENKGEVIRANKVKPEKKTKRGGIGGYGTQR